MKRWVLVLALTSGAAQAQRTAVYQDAFGYSVLSSEDALCDSSFIDIANSGSELTLVGDGDAQDEGAATASLDLPFTFYGDVHTDVVVASNGYISFGEDDGRDFSNDCPLPAVPGNAVARGARAMALHDDLSGQDAGQLLQQFFEVCPRTAASGAGACTVFQWNDWRAANDASATFQVVLYHASRGIVFQYQTLDAIDSATIGLQNLSATSAANAGCNLQLSISEPRAICFYEPAFPALAPSLVFADGFD